jgi:hypothetical protein
MGWKTIKDRELLALAAGRFDMFVTVDRNLSIQQSLAPLPISVFALHAKTNRLSDLKPLVPSLLAALETARQEVCSYHQRSLKFAGAPAASAPSEGTGKPQPAAKLLGAGLTTFAPSSAISITARPRSLVPSARKRNTPSAPLKPDMFVSAAWL